MDDHVAQVDQYPFAGGFAFNAQDSATGFLDLVAYRRRQRLGLPIRGSRYNRDTVEQAGQVYGVKHADVLGFDVFESVDDESLQFFDVHLAFVEMM